MWQTEYKGAFDAEYHGDVATVWPEPNKAMQNDMKDSHVVTWSLLTWGPETKRQSNRWNRVYMHRESSHQHRYSLWEFKRFDMTSALLISSSLSCWVTIFVSSLKLSCSMDAQIKDDCIFRITHGNQDARSTWPGILDFGLDLIQHFVERTNWRLTPYIKQSSYTPASEEFTTSRNTDREPWNLFTTVLMDSTDKSAAMPGKFLKLRFSRLDGAQIENLKMNAKLTI